MRFYWCVFYHRTKRKPGTLEVPDQVAIRQVLEDNGMSMWDVKEAWLIPYPAWPKINDISGFPCFCMDPEGDCRDRAACPKRMSCTE